MFQTAIALSFSSFGISFQRTFSGFEMHFLDEA